MIQRYLHPYRFYFWSTLIPWGFWLLAAYFSHRVDAHAWGGLIGALSIAGLGAPVLVAWYYLQKDPHLLADVSQRFFFLRRGQLSYLLLAIVLMPASILLAMTLSLLFGYDSGQFVISGDPTFTSGVLPVWLILLMAPVLEEIAWHSYGTDSLRQRHSLFVTSMLFAVIWTLWHIPLAFINNYYHSNLVLEGAIYSLNFMISIFPFVLLMNWLYYKTGRNILVAVILHMAANFFNEIFATHPDSKIIQTVLLSILAIYVVYRERSFFFDRGLLSAPSVPSRKIVNAAKPADVRL